MSQSWRITTTQRNLTGSVSTVVNNVGATVIRAPKGPVVPIKVPVGNEGMITSIFGVPSSTYPDLWEAIEYNKKADLWISAPSKTSTVKYGGVLVTKTGTEALLGGVSTKSITLNNLPVAEEIGLGDGSTTTFTFTLTKKTHYKNQSVGLTVNGTSINVSATDAATEILSTNPNVGSGTYVRATGVLTFTFSTPPAMNAIIDATYNTDRSADAYCALLDANPQADDLSALVTYDTNQSAFVINLYQTDYQGNVSSLPNSPYVVSLVSGAVDGSNRQIYITTVFQDDYYVTPVVGTLTYSTFVNDLATTNFSGGSRGDAITITELTTGWNYFQKFRQYPANIFFDNTADAGVPALFQTLRSTYQKYQSYILPLPNTNYATAKTNKQALSTADRGISFYWNWGLVTDNYHNSKFYTTLTGRVAGKYADMVTVFNGLAPSWIDEDGYGGQLGGGIISMAYDPSEGDLQDADSNQINPIIFDPQYGVMITSQKTSQTTLNDYSYIGHSRLADYIIYNIINQALPAQITKLNDVTHRTLVKSKIEAIINPLLAFPYNLLSDAGVVCDTTNNTPLSMSKQEFNVSVGIQFTPFSERINLLFVTVPQGTTVKSIIGG